MFLEEAMKLVELDLLPQKRNVGLLKKKIFGNFYSREDKSKFIG
jgi:hypothetical protein